MNGSTFASRRAERVSGDALQMSDGFPKKQKRRRERFDVRGDDGADDQIRTDYLVITNDVLYLLSYISARNAHYNQWARRMQVFFSISRKKI